MAVGLSRTHADANRDDPHAKPVARSSVDERTFGRTLATKFPPYVFGRRPNACLVHVVERVELHWYRFAGIGWLVRLARPVAIAQTKCQQSFRLDSDIARTCVVPNPDALLCGRCQGQRATFPKRGPSRADASVTRRLAGDRLGCIVAGHRS